MMNTFKTSQNMHQLPGCIQLSVIFGLHLDGSYPRGDEGLGLLRAGPRGFLEFLELHLGLYSKPSSTLERTAAFLAVLKRNESILGCFRRSFEADPLATAARLLEWLDTWSMHGWDGGVPDDAPPRVLELVQLSRKAEGRVAPSEGERLAMVREALERGMNLPVDSVLLCEPPGHHPAAWRRVLALLPCAAWDAGTCGNPASGTDLDRLKTALSGQKTGDFTGDGTVNLYSSETTIGAARFLAGHVPDAQGALVIAGLAGGLWDEACASVDIPRPGCSGSRVARPALQFLPLALAVRRAPLDLKALLDFLTHPICPLGYESRYFANALAADGGLEGPAWEEALQRARESYRRYGKGEGRLQELLSAWILPDRQDPDAFPIEAARSLTRQVCQYLNGRMRSLPGGTAEEISAHEAAISQCRQFLGILDLLAEAYEAVPFPLLERFLASASYRAGGGSEGYRELGAIPWAGDPGEVVDPVERLIWFLPERPESPEPWPWSQAEIRSLACKGLELPDMVELNARTTLDWIRAVSLASRRLDIILPHSGTESHPLILLAESLGARAFPGTVEAEALMGAPGSASVLHPVRLPGPVRWWRIARSASFPREWNASYSQIRVFLERPAQWVLRYLAKIEAPSILSIPDRSTLAGSFAHTLVEDCLETFGLKAVSLGKDEFEDWYGSAFEDLLARQGSRWLEAGATQERLRLRELLRSSIRTLLGTLAGTGISGIESEKPLAGTIADLPFQGKADLILATASGQDAIVDMKNTRWLAGYKEYLETDTDIQLTIYSELYRQATGKEAEAAYYLIPLERMLARSPSRFAGAIQIESSSTHRDRLGRIVNSIDWRKRQLEQGSIEVVCAATAASEEAATPPPDGLAPGEPYDGFDPYLSLYGWSEEE